MCSAASGPGREGRGEDGVRMGWDWEQCQPCYELTAYLPSPVGFICKMIVKSASQGERGPAEMTHTKYSAHHP
jgi:hypothetical protein